jgi:hypothetical protein
MIKVHRLFPSIIGVFVLGAVSFSDRVSASPAEVFQSHLDQIQQQLPAGYRLRLPTEILLGGPGLSPEDMKKLIVRVEPTGSEVTISLLTCENAPYPCLVGSFSVASAESEQAQMALYLHEIMSAPVTLDKGIQAHVQDGSRMNPPSDYSSAMWQQDGMIYTVTFLAAERQNILLMARSMALQEPIGSSSAVNN